MRDITIKTDSALGLALRTRRMAKGLSQAALAELIGVERKWVIRLEAGNHAAELGNVLKAVEVLGLELVLRDADRSATSGKSTRETSRLDEVFENLKRDRP